jgi:soluble lytic murein transglycosylase-like protein
MKARSLLRYVIATLLVLVVISVFHRKPSVSGTSFTGSHVRVLICAGKDFPRLSCGYVYDLIRRFSAEARFSADIAFVRDSSWVDSLRAGTADLFAIDGSRLPDDSLQLAVSVPLPGHYVLAVPASDIARMQEINRYLHREQTAKGYQARIQRYLRPYSPSRPNQGTYLGPYDEIFKQEAQKIGWDWRLLASVAYKESRFHIEGQSRKGAVGLMQLLPGTAARFGAADPIDPQQSVAAAATYLSYIEKLLVRRHEDLRLEHALVLASYNAGEGQILRCLQTLDSLHVSASVWENVIQTIPSVEGFKGKETVAYVKEVLDLYEDIKRFLPSLQDRPGQ